MPITQVQTENMEGGGGSSSASIVIMQEKYQENIFLELSAPNTVSLISDVDCRPKIDINDLVYQILSSLTLSTSGFTVDKFYDIYAYYNGTTVSLVGIICS
jgi:hypothetical protein